jgi:hypothetical protein
MPRTILFDFTGASFRCQRQTFRSRFRGTLDSELWRSYITNHISQTKTEH